MSNLGGYQTITKLIKRLGGPKKAVLILGAASYLVGRAAEESIRQIIKKIKNKTDKEIESLPVYEIKEDASTNENVLLAKGAKIKVLERDGDVVLIDLIGDQNSPYLVSLDLISKITDYKVKD